MSENEPVLILDCKDQICPKPVFMVKNAIFQAVLGQIIEIIVNDDGSKQNVLKYCWNHGQEIVRSYPDDEDFHIFVKKSIEKVVDSPVPVIGPCGTRWD